MVSAIPQICKFLSGLAGIANWERNWLLAFFVVENLLILYVILTTLALVSAGIQARQIAQGQAPNAISPRSLAAKNWKNGSLAPTAETSQAPSKYLDDVTYICISSTDKVPATRPGQIVYVSKGEFLAWGGTAILERLPSGTVMKTPIPNPHCRIKERDHRQNMCVEAKIYARIGDNPLVPKLISWDDETCCLELEYLENGNLKEYVRQNNDNITLEHRLQWSIQASEAMGILHKHSVIHGDLSPRKFLLDSKHPLHQHWSLDLPRHELRSWTHLEASR
ncbi:kinase-like domain-containing protein [Aspergillus germanicus]